MSETENLNTLPSEDSKSELFADIASVDFLGFEFMGKSYAQQIDESRQNTGKLCAVTVEIRKIKGIKVVWMYHDFRFLGGSLGCAEGEKLCRGFEFAYQNQLPVVAVCRSGGARMQEGTLALMQMAKVSVSVAALKRRRLPFISVCLDPTYGGVSASYAMQGDIRIAVRSARIGFAGPQVILNTVYKMNQKEYDKECPQSFQTSEFLQKYGQIDIVLDDESELEGVCGNILNILYKRRLESEKSTYYPEDVEKSDSLTTEEIVFEDDSTVQNPEGHNDHLTARNIDRYTAADVIKKVFNNYIELSGDGKVGSDDCLKGGIALLNDIPCVLFANLKGPEHNFGMASPHGYRFALRLMELAEHFEIPVFSLVDTVGAYPSFESEQLGQSEALATNLVKMAQLRVPIVSLILGEGGSGGALAIAMGNRIGMMERGYYAVISPEGAASILGRYEDENHKAQQFPKDCKKLSLVQKIFAHQLKELGVIDTIIGEKSDENVHNCDRVMDEIKQFFLRSFKKLSKKNSDQLINHRYGKFRIMGKYQILSHEDLEKVKIESKKVSSDRVSRRQRKPSVGPQSKTLKFIADQTINSQYSLYLGKQPSGVITPKPIKQPNYNVEELMKHENAKYILDNHGADALVKWIQNQKKVLITDTTMRDAHQSLLATRVRTYDLLNCAEETAVALKDAFSIEMWGGATFDVCYRFLNEDPWERLKLLRKKVPNILFQMLLRGSNGVGYTSYPDNVIEKFVELSAKNGIDVFRIFDCFNDVSQMKISIDAVRKSGKIAEVCICFTGNFLSESEKIYTLDYYKNLCKEIVKSGAHIIGIKDMAGLMKPQMVKPFLDTIREVTDLPIHFHCHNTSSASLATAINMAEYGCHIIDLAIASMADTTSQPSLNSFLAAMEGHERDPGIPYLSLENLDQYWSQVRTVYQQYESGLKCGTARVYDHQIPGGQYSNLYAQCASLGIMNRWNEVVDMYKDVNQLFGDIVKVTPSSKCVGDMALYLIKNNLTCDDVRERGENFEYPASVVSLFMGELGFPHHGFPEDISNKVLKGKKPNTTRPGDLLEPVNFEEHKAILQQKYNSSISDEDLISSLLYPKVFDDFMKSREEFGWKITWLDSITYLFGMNFDQPITVEYPTDGKSLDQLEAHTIILKRIGPLTKEGNRILEFLVDGNTRKARVTDKAVVAANLKTRKADSSNPNHLASPLPGVVEVIFVGENSEVKKKDPIMMVSAMKMEVQIVAQHDGKVSELSVKVGDRVDIGSLVAIIEPKK